MATPGVTLETPLDNVEINIPSDMVFERVVRESALVVAKHLGFSRRPGSRFATGRQ